MISYLYGLNNLFTKKNNMLPCRDTGMQNEDVNASFPVPKGRSFLEASRLNNLIPCRDTGMQNENGGAIFRVK
ncbi:MAG: hypothetical protein APR55_08770 [Methanolinea sp. SDB]|nr:MAG: hypothetical protein APR55_08770 [Methanolinea sp. SDB]